MAYFMTLKYFLQSQLILQRKHYICLNIAKTDTATLVQPMIFHAFVHNLCKCVGCFCT